MEAVLRDLDLTTLIDLLGFEHILLKICSVISREKFMQLIDDPRFKKYVEISLDDREEDEQEFIHALCGQIDFICTSNDIRKLIHTRLPRHIVPDLATYMVSRPYNELHKHKYIASVFNNPKFGKDEEIMRLLARFGIYKHQNVQQIDTPYFNQRSKKVKTIICEAKLKEHSSINNIILMKILCKMYPNAPCYVYSVVKPIMICYLFKLQNSHPGRPLFCYFIGNGLVLYQRKSLDTLKMLCKKDTQKYMNQTKLVHKLLIKTFAKFTTKNMTKLILYHV